MRRLLLPLAALVVIAGPVQAQTAEQFREDARAVEALVNERYGYLDRFPDQRMPMSEVLRAEAEAEELRSMIDAVEQVADHLGSASTDDRLAASYPFLTMLSVAVAGWLMERQGREASRDTGDSPFLAMKRAAATYYVKQILPESIGLKAAACASAEPLFALDSQAFAV